MPGEVTLTLMLGVVTEGRGPKEGWVTMVKTQSHHGGALVRTG